MHKGLKLNKYKNIWAIPLTIFISFIFTACEDKEKVEVKQVQEKTSVNIYTMKTKTHPIWVDFTGKTEALENVFVTSRVNGELEKVFFKAGDIVKKGDILFKIDDREYKAILAQKEATLKKDQASLKLAIANFNRYSPLVKKGLAPKEKLDELNARVDEYKAIVSADKFSVKEARLDVIYSEVEATIDGKIGKSLVDIGNIITNADKLANIVQTNQLYVNFDPSSSEIFLLNKYKSEEYPRILVQPESIQESTVNIPGRVDFIDNKTNEMTGTVSMRAIIPNEQKLLFPGTFVNIKLFVTDKISFKAVHPNNLGQNQLGVYVLTVDANNKIVKKQLEVEYSNEYLAIIRAGLKDGDRIIASAINRLREGQEVIPTEVENPIKFKE